MFIATFNNISVISWRSVLLVEENGVPGENHFKISLLFHLFFLYLTCSYPYSYNLMLTATNHDTSIFYQKIG
jgi:hypothetical protein